MPLSVIGTNHASSSKIDGACNGVDSVECFDRIIPVFSFGFMSGLYEKVVEIAGVVLRLFPQLGDRAKVAAVGPPVAILEKPGHHQLDLVGSVAVQPIQLVENICPGLQRFIPTGLAGWW